jgi:citrate synthase
MTRRPPAHQGSAAGKAHEAEPWATAISATTDEHVYVRGVALDEAIGREPFPAILLRLWRGDSVEPGEAELLGACLVASVDHGPLSPSALVSRTIASTRATPMAGLAGGILAFGELHGAVVSRAMKILAAAHFVEEQARQRPMRTIDPTVAQYDGVPIPDVEPEETST